MNPQLFNFHSKTLQAKISTEWKCPSNIALIKYWGKKPLQLPCNASLSITLKEAFTQTKIEASPFDNLRVEFFLENERNEAFEKKIEKYLTSISIYLPFIAKTYFRIQSNNSFPHSSGIASSASGFGALALNLLDIHYQLESKEIDEIFYQRASYLARLGSGSACRSIYGGFTVWGEHQKVTGSSDEFATPVSSHKNYEGIRDFILLVEKGVKKVSSTVGHGLMNNHPYAEARFQQAENNLTALLENLRHGHVNELGRLTELEALSLHAMMMTSTPHFLLFKPNSIAIIEKIMAFREQNGAEIYFTLDAGANVHVICSNKSAEVCHDFIKSDLLCYCENENYICDQLGQGPERIIGSI